MKWLKNRFLLMAYILLMVLLVSVGCTLKEDPAEVLPLCGNHSCGDLAMVTTDTSSDGFQYLGPRMSPDGTRILFTADWKAIPAIDHYDEDELYTLFRQLIVIPKQSSVDPATDLADQGGILVRFNGDYTTIWIGGSAISLSDIEAERRKGDPCWIDDSNIAFFCSTNRGYRLFTADITGICNDLACKVIAYPAYMEPTDADLSGGQFHHMSPSVSPNGRFMVFTRSGCALPDSFETCTGSQLMVLDMETVGLDFGYDAFVRPITNEYSRLEKPRWSPDGSKLVLSGGLDFGGSGSGAGTELFTIDFDSTAFVADEVELDNNVQRLTFTSLLDGDPISGVFNTSPSYSPDGSEIVFVSTRRAPSITLHDRNLWKIPSDGRLDPEILYFTRADDVDPMVLDDGSILISSQLGFPTEILNQLEEEAYQALVQGNDGSLTEVEMRSLAADERRMLEFFEGVMSHLYIFQP
jgi:Tol biopolymer transport system component